MTPQQAWELLVQATAALSANREVHDKIKEALTVLKPTAVEKPSQSFSPTLSA